MNKVIIMVFSILILAGCQFPTSSMHSEEILEPYNLTNKQLDDVQRDLKSQLKDPDSARFGNIVAGKSYDGTVTVCGFVNAKNSFGGYTGMEPFYGLMMMAGKKSIFTPIQIGGSDTHQQVTLMLCHQKGLEF